MQTKGSARSGAGEESMLQPLPSRNTQETGINELLDEGRSSSLSELEDGPEEVDIDSANTGFTRRMEVDSEAETERLDNSPEKNTNKKGYETGSIEYMVSASKLVESMLPPTMNNEASSDSAVSSPGSTPEDLASETRSDQSAISDPTHNGAPISQDTSTRKRKLFNEENGTEDNVGEEQSRRRRRLTPSRKSDGEEGSRMPSREPTIEPLEDPPGSEAVLEGSSDVLRNVHGALKNRLLKGARAKNAKAKGRRILKGILEERADLDGVPDLGADEAPAEADDEDRPEGDDEDTEAAAKDEEEYSKKMAAMDSLAALERHFAVLRDRLYDERIAGLNDEIARLSAQKPSHSGYLRQLECIHKYRDDKFDSEQKLLVYKIRSLKTKSVAQRSQIHSGYFQTVRDVREKHLDRIGERLSRLRRDHAKIDEKVINHTIPFPTRRSVQINQQTSYNKEVSILSGIAKYVGFPAAPTVVSAQQIEMDEDMEKMGITLNNAKNQKPRPTRLGRTNLSAAMSRPAAEEQFLEQNPWANPHHPVHQQHIGRLSRQVSDQTRMADMTVTPAAQKFSVDQSKHAGSASTIPERLSAQRSSTAPTPFTDGDCAQRPSFEMMAMSRAQPRVTNVGDLRQQRERSQSLSPTETRKRNTAVHDSGQRKVGSLGVTTNVKGSSDPSSQGSRPSALGSFDSTNWQDSLTRHGALHSEVDGRLNPSPHVGLHPNSRRNNLAPTTGLSRIGA